MPSTVPFPVTLSDADLLAATESLSARLRLGSALFVAHLAEVFARGLHLTQGYKDEFEYCCEAMRLSEDEAYNRVKVAICARAYPVVLDYLKDGSLKLTSIRLLAPHLTPENHLHLLESARGKRKWDVEKLVAALAPRPDVRTTLRRLPVREGAPAQTGMVAAPTAPPLAPLPAQIPDRPPLSKPAVASLKPLAPERYSFGGTISERTRDLWRMVGDLLGHAVPSGDFDQTLRRVLEIAAAELVKSKAGITDHPLAAGIGRTDTRYGPVEVRRIVWVRDGGRCTYVSLDGRRCTETRRLEFHHRRPFAVGGEWTVQNIALMCDRHNRHEARLYFDRPEASTAAAHRSGTTPAVRSAFPST